MRRCALIQQTIKHLQNEVECERTSTGVGPKQRTQQKPIRLYPKAPKGTQSRTTVAVHAYMMKMKNVKENRVTALRNSSWDERRAETIQTNQARARWNKAAQELTATRQVYITVFDQLHVLKKLQTASDEVFVRAREWQALYTPFTPLFLGAAVVVLEVDLTLQL
jgi:hypothetical protein